MLNNFVTWFIFVK